MTINIVKGPVPGVIERITELHGTYYREQAGFGPYFESKVASELSAFVAGFDARRDGMWLAQADGEVHASIAIDGREAQTDAAHLRWFIASEQLRGSGTGNALLTAALDFCRSCSYRRVRLWTFEGLQAARHLYEKHGFHLVRQQVGRQWGAEVNEQCFELSLPHASTAVENAEEKK
jgi:GNAT superfamily N-acetyltransferase